MDTCPEVYCVRPRKGIVPKAGSALLIRTLAGLDQSQEPGCANGGKADRGMNTAALCRQLTSVVAALAAAGLWFWSSSVKLPPMFEDIERLKSALDLQARRNKVAAIVTGAAVLLAAAATICEAFE